MQGEIVIGTKLDNKQLEKDLRKEERELEKFKKEAEKLTKEKIELDVAVKDLDAVFKQLDDYLAELKAEMAEIELGGTTIDNPRYEEYMEYAQEIEGYEQTRQMLLEQSKKKYEEINLAMQQNAHNQEITNQRIVEMKEKLGQVNELEKIKNSINSVGKSMIGIVKKAGMWVLALVGVRGAFSFIRSSMSTLSQYDDKLARDQQYISYLLATTVKPIIEWILKLVYKILAYIRYLAKAWFNIDIFAHASTEEFLKQRDAMSGTNKEAKELRKTLMGFDEMNILNDNVNATSDVGGLADEIPELTNLDDIKIPGIVQGFGAIGDGARTAMSGVDDFFTGLKTGANTTYQTLKDTFSPIANQVKEKIFKPITENASAFFTDIFNKTGNSITNIATETSKITVWIRNNVISPLTDSLNLLWQNTTTGFSQTWNGIKTSLSSVTGWIYRNAIKPTLDKIKTGIEKMFDGLKTAIISPINWIIEALNTVISGLNKISIKIPNWVPHYGGKKWGFNIKKIPKIELATGGIISMPGKGIPVGNAVGGERGAEGVIPLTNSQQMSLLGEAIGKYITVNLTNVTELDGRILARRVSEVNNNTNFLLNKR